MARRLIVNADDFGRSPGVSSGILRAHREGIVTSTSVMVNQPGVAEQVRDALACPALGMGLHLTFTAWRPVLPPEEVPDLVSDDGMFLDQHTVWAQAEEIPVRQLRAELMAQVERFRDLAGRPPDHLDCHHFVHLYPPFFEVYADLAARQRLPLRVPFPPESDFRKALHTLPFLEGFPPDVVRGMIATDSALLRMRGLRHPDRFLSGFFGRRALRLASLVGLIEGLQEGVSELMCHPGFCDEALESSTYRSERETELALLTHPAVREQVREVGVELVTFSVLGG